MNKNSYPLIINETIITIYKRVLVPYINSFRNILSPLQFLTLCIVERNNESTVTTLSNAMNMPKQNMTKIITKLEELNFICKKQNEDDKRITNVLLTEKATDFMKENSLDNSNRMCKLLSTLSESELNEFFISLKKINSILSELEEEHY